MIALLNWPRFTDLTRAYRGDFEELGKKKGKVPREVPAKDAPVRETRSGRTYDILTEDPHHKIIIQRASKQSGRSATTKASRTSVKLASKALYSAKLVGSKHNKNNGRDKSNWESDSEAEDDEEYKPTKRKRMSSLIPLPHSDSDFTDLVDSDSDLTELKDYDSDMTDLEDLGAAEDDLQETQVNPSIQPPTDPLTGDSTTLETNKTNATQRSTMISVTDENGPSPLSGKPPLPSPFQFDSVQETSLLASVGKTPSVLMRQIKQALPSALALHQTLPLSPETETSEGASLSQTDWTEN